MRLDNTSALGRRTLVASTSARDTRRAAQLMIDSFLAQQRTLTAQVNMRPTAATVYLTIVQACGRQKGSATISRRSLATATGLPRETVRRIVIDLIADGHVVDHGRGVSVPEGALPLREIQKTLPGWAAELAILCDEVKDLDIRSEG